MTIPKEIVEKMEQVNALNKEINEWMQENLDDTLDGTIYDGLGNPDYYQFTNKPTGEEQFDGEYCEQHTGYCEDDYYGKYYYPTEKGNYFWFDYHI